MSILRITLHNHLSVCQKCCVTRNMSKCVSGRGCSPDPTRELTTLPRPSSQLGRVHPCPDSIPLSAFDASMLVPSAQAWCPCAALGLAAALDGHIMLLSCLSAVGEATSLYVVERFQWNFPQIFIMWMWKTENVVKVRGCRSRSSARLHLKTLWMHSIFLLTGAFQWHLPQKYSSYKWEELKKFSRSVVKVIGNSLGIHLFHQSLRSFGIPPVSVTKCANAIYRRHTQFDGVASSIIC